MTSETMKRKSLSIQCLSSFCLVVVIESSLAVVPIKRIDAVICTVYTVYNDINSKHSGCCNRKE
ncbi:hypothetical protein D3C74_277340 [compost metagenome]